MNVLEKMRSGIIVYMLLASVAFLTTLCPTGACAQKLGHTTTHVSADSVFEFDTSQSRLGRTSEKKVYYSFVNFRLTPQMGTRADTYLHGDFENRSYTTNRLYAIGKFRFGLKHGEWRTWHADGSLITVERWAKGKLKKRRYFDGPDGAKAIVSLEAVKKRHKKRKSEESKREGDTELLRSEKRKERRKVTTNTND